MTVSYAIGLNNQSTIVEPGLYHRNNLHRPVKTVQAEFKRSELLLGAYLQVIYNVFCSGCITCELTG